VQRTRCIVIPVHTSHPFFRCFWLSMKSIVLSPLLSFFLSFFTSFITRHVTARVIMTIVHMLGRYILDHHPFTWLLHAFPAHNCYIRDARTHSFPASVGLVQACPNDVPCTLKTSGYSFAQRKPKPVLHYALYKKLSKWHLKIHICWIIVLTLWRVPEARWW